MRAMVLDALGRLADSRRCCNWGTSPIRSRPRARSRSCECRWGRGHAASPATHPMLPILRILFVRAKARG